MSQISVIIVTNLSKFLNLYEQCVKSLKSSFKCKLLKKLEPFTDIFFIFNFMQFIIRFKFNQE